MSVPARMRHVEVGHRAGPREPRVDVDQLGPAPLGLHHPLEADRVALGHVRAHDHDAVAVGEVLLERGGAAAPERGPQTGDRASCVICGPGSRSATAPSAGEQLLDQVVLLVVERRAAEVGEAAACGSARRLARRAPSQVARAGGDHAVGDHVHRLLERRAPPTRVPCGRRYWTFVLAARAGDELQRRRALRAQPAARDRRVRVALDLRRPRSSLT